MRPPPFCENDSEIETTAREIIAMDFYFIAQAYPFSKADIEELIARREVIRKRKTTKENKGILQSSSFAKAMAD
ncbi:DUF5713 family protein [Marinifilum fragile]|uniref:DUF5713 family protein n=1 Tax=Marinifilum fragile TaxID=570161 RepID=UPI0012F8957C|nr:DUF5713 family protein [Marinifilum fragile]